MKDWIELCKIMNVKDKGKRAKVVELRSFFLPG